VDKNALYEVTTIIEKDDLRKFLYFTTFRKKFITIPLIVLIAAVCSFFTVYMIGNFNLIKFLLIWLILIIIAFGVISFKIELKSKKEINLQKIGNYRSEQTITFYENYVIATNKSAKGTYKIKYSKLYQIQETKNYYIIYNSAKSASLIRKKDIDVGSQNKIKDFLHRKLGKQFKKIIS